MKKCHQKVFSPNLPKDKIQAYNQINSGILGKYFVEWNKPWRKSNEEPIMMCWDKHDLEHMELPKDWVKGCFEIVNIDPNGTLMMLWIVGDAARSADTLDDEQIKDDIGRLLSLFQDKPVPTPDHLYRHRWSLDEFALGAYSTPSIQSSEATFEVTGKPVPSEDNPRLMFAGEATDPVFWSFLHGARDSGGREAKRILAQKI